MRLLYANVIEEHAGWGAECSMNRALQRLGHETVCIDYRKHRRRLVHAFSEARDCDAFLLQRGDQFPTAIVKAMQRPAMFWNTELVSRCEDNLHLLRANRFDHVFLRTQACIDTVVGQGWMPAAKCSVLLSACDAELYHPVQGVQRDIDVLFVGHTTPRRERFLADLAVPVTVQQAYGEELAQLYGRARIVLNIHAEDKPDLELRVFEVLGCGACLVSEPLAPENPFAADELVEASGAVEMKVAIERLLADEAEREAIAARGHAAVKRSHIVDQRAHQIMDVCSGLVAEAGTQGPMLPLDWRLRLRLVYESLRGAGRVLLSPLRGRRGAACCGGSEA